MSLNVESHIETYLAALAGESSAPDAAETHLELWLAYMLSKLGTDSDAPGVVGLMKMVTLWENASPDSSTFEPQSLPIPHSDYDYIMFEVKFYSGAATVQTEIMSSVTGGGISSFAIDGVARRGISMASADSIDILGARYSEWISITSGLENNEAYIIPLKIIGIKVVA